MNDKTRNILLLGVLGVIGYFIYKDYRVSTTAATSNSSAPFAASSNLGSPVNGLVNTATGYLNTNVVPAVQSTALDYLDNALNGGGVGSGGSMDNSGGSADDES